MAKEYGYCIFCGLYRNTEQVEKPKCPYCSDGQCIVPIGLPRCTRCIGALHPVTYKDRPTDDEIVGWKCPNCITDASFTFSEEEGDG